ncbi:hypothetical protein PM082_007082 [Marasmius tenuissimus]|nr:hypothetical protein PM082_007082 [Marasmius tenuissimus]
MKFLLSILTLAGAIHGKIIYAGVNEVSTFLNSRRLTFAVAKPPMNSPEGNLALKIFLGHLESTMPSSIRQDRRLLSCHGLTDRLVLQSAVDVFVDQENINLFRVTFLMERMCPLATGLGSTFNETYFDEYADAINYITVEKGVYALLDPHNYMRYNDPSSQPFSGSVIGNTSDPTAATTEQFGEFWTELAGRFVDNPKVIFGINNEPHDMPTSLVLANNQAAIDGIRSTGAEQLILAPGNAFTGGHSWTEGSDPSSALIHEFVDPLNNTGIDVHEYLDVDFSGTHDECVQPGMYLNKKSYLNSLPSHLILCKCRSGKSGGSYCLASRTRSQVRCLAFAFYPT